MSIETAIANIPEQTPINSDRINFLNRIKSPEYSDGIDAKILKTRLDDHTEPSGRQVLINVLEQLGVLPNETESAGEQERKAIIHEIDEATFEYLSEYFKEGLSARLRLDIDKIENLMDETKEYENTPALAALDGLRERAELSSYIQQITEANRIARILFLK